MWMFITCFRFTLLFLPPGWRWRQDQSRTCSAGGKGSCDIDPLNYTCIHFFCLPQSVLDLLIHSGLWRLRWATVFLRCLLASAFCVGKCWRTLAKLCQGRSERRTKQWAAWCSGPEPVQRGLFSLFIVSIVMFWRNLMSFGSIWLTTSFHHIPSMSRIERRRWWVLKVLHLTSSYRCFTSCISRLATFPSPRIDEPINSGIEHFRGCGSSSGAWQQGGENNGEHGNMLG